MKGGGGVGVRVLKMGHESIYIFVTISHDMVRISEYDV